MQNLISEDSQLDREKFIERHNNCALCGSEVEIKTEANYEFGTIREEAFCTCCKIKTRSSEHAMQ